MPITNQFTIFECEYGKVWRANGNYGTFKAGHMFVVEMAKQIERLTERVIELEAQIAAEDAAHAWVQDGPQPETMCDYPNCTDEGCPCQYWREPTQRSDEPAQQAGA
jgi:hypothetical protein